MFFLMNNQLDKSMKTQLLFSIFICHLLLACSQSHVDLHSQDADLAVQHEALTKHFEYEANQLQMKIDEHKKFLYKLDTKSYLYGKHTQDFKEHCDEILNLYERAASKNRELADMFRKKED